MYGSQPVPSLYTKGHVIYECTFLLSSGVSRDENEELQQDVAVLDDANTGDSDIIEDRDVGDDEMEGLGLRISYRTLSHENICLHCCGICIVYMQSITKLTMWSWSWLSHEKL